MFGHFSYLRDKLLKKRIKIEVDLSVETSNLTHDQISTALKSLRILGLEGKCQQLTKHDCIEFLYAMGLNPTDDIIDSKLSAFKLQHRKAFTFGQLAHIWHSMLQNLTDEDEILKRAFQFFDKDANGEISVQELRTTMHEMGDLLSEDELNTFMQILDVNQDGAIGYNEFLATLKTQSSLVVEMPEGEDRQPQPQQQQPQLQSQQQQQQSRSDTIREGLLLPAELLTTTQPLPGSSPASSRLLLGIETESLKLEVASPRLDAPQASCLAQLARTESQMRRSKDVVPAAAGTAAAGVTVVDGGNAGGLRTPSCLD